MKRVLEIFRDGNKHVSTLTTPLVDGEQANIQTLTAMADVLKEQLPMRDVRSFVLREIVKDASGHDAATQVGRIFEYTRDRIRYQRDPFGVERVADIWSTLYGLNPDTGPEGDCGIKTLFMATCCAVVGHKPLFVIIKQVPGQQFYNHVYNAVIVDGELKHYDATPGDKPAGWEAPSVEKVWVDIWK